jgi:hypothetical protein
MQNFQKGLTFIRDWGLLILCGLFITFYIILSSGIGPETDFTSMGQVRGIATNTMFAIINLFATVYISKKISVWGWQTENIENQKKIAKTSIRHIRNYLTSILKLLKITNEKVEISKDELNKQFFKEIKNHLEILYSGVKQSESDFKEIVNEELQEQNLLETEISGILDTLQEKNEKLKELEQKTTDKTTEIESLRKEIKKLKEEVSSKSISLPFGNSFIPNPALSLDNSFAFEPRKGKSLTISRSNELLTNKTIEATPEKVKLSIPVKKTE